MLVRSLLAGGFLGDMTRALRVHQASPCRYGATRRHVSSWDSAPCVPTHLQDSTARPPAQREGHPRHQARSFLHRRETV